jgi:NACHT domain
MNEELDINRVAADFVSQNVENIYNMSKGVLKGAADKIRLRLQNSYSSYVICVAHRYSKAKSFFIRNEPTNLYDFYIPIGLSSKDRIEAPSINALATVNSFVIITGGGGSGKSMLMRHLFLNTLAMKEKVPVFLELRELNQRPIPLLSFLEETLHSNKFELDHEYIVKALRAGHFALFLDGFDEVALSSRKDLTKEIQEFSKLYDQNLIVISSRPDNEFAGWPSFTTLSINPLNIAQACELVEKLPFDDGLKSKFLVDLKKDLFKKHESFLSNPLLLSIMLLTYGQSADIPNKLSLFYNQAYEALFQRHDALKGAFQRERLSNLDIQDYGRVFSAFCIQTYDKRAFQFSKSEALDYLDKAKRIVNLEFDTGHYLSDALQAICLLIEEGLLIVFAHRSFQEYFVARFLCHLQPRIQERMIEKYAKSFLYDDVMNLLYEMDPELVERAFILPSLEKLAQLIRLKTHLGITHYLRYLKSQYPRFELTDTNIRGFSSSSRLDLYGTTVSFVLYHCGSLVGWYGFPKHVDDIRFLRKKYGKGPIDISKMTYRDDFIVDLASQDHFFSKKTLQLTFDIREALLEKHRNANKSIDELLLAS